MVSRDKSFLFDKKTARIPARLEGTLEQSRFSIALSEIEPFPMCRPLKLINEEPRAWQAHCLFLLPSSLFKSVPVVVRYQTAVKNVTEKEEKKNIPEPFDKVHPLYPSTANGLLDHPNETFDDECRFFLDAARRASWAETFWSCARSVVVACSGSG